MAEAFIHKNLADKRKQILAYIGSLERDLEQARRDLSAIVATERVFQSRGPKVTAYMELAALFPRHALPDHVKATLVTSQDGMTASAIASRILWASTKAVLYWQFRSRLIWIMEMPLAPFTIRQIAASKSVNDILRLAKMVPDVTEN